MAINTEKLNDFLPALKQNCDTNLEFALEKQMEVLDQNLEYDCSGDSLNFSITIKPKVDKFWLE